MCLKLTSFCKLKKKKILQAPGNQLGSTLNRSDAVQTSTVNQQPKFSLSFPGLGTPLPQLPGPRKKFPPKLNFNFCSASILPGPDVPLIQDNFKMASTKWSDLTDCFNQTCTFLVPEHPTEPRQRSETVSYPRTWRALQLSQALQNATAPQVNQQQF